MSTDDKITNVSAVAEPTTEAPDWTALDGRSNSSPKFLELVAEIERLIRGDAHLLLAGRAERTARLIVAKLAHEHGLAPLATQADEITQLRGALANARAVAADRLADRDKIAHDLIAERDAVVAAHQNQVAAHEQARNDAVAAERSLSDLREAVGALLAERLAQATRLGPPTDQTSGPDRVAWLLCDEDVIRLRAALDQPPTAPPAAKICDYRDHDVFTNRPIVCAGPDDHAPNKHTFRFADDPAAAPTAPPATGDQT